MIANKTPEISVILPVYNAAPYVVKAVQSMLRQSFTNFELLLINDGSTDDTDAIIKAHCLADARVRYISRENKGLIATLNEGIRLSLGRYIARMDADDISEPERLALQYQYLTSHPDVAAVGCAYQLMDEQENIINIRKPPRYNWLIKPLFLFGSPFAHPSMMLNKGLIGQHLHYNDAYQYAEDYELWLRLSLRFKLANLAKPLLKYRVLNTSVSRKYATEQRASAARALAEHLCQQQDPETQLHAQVLMSHAEQSVSTLIKSFCYILKRCRGRVNPLLAFCYLIYFSIT